MPFGAAMNEPWNNPTISRRDFFKLARHVLLTTSGVIGLAGLLRYFAFQTEPPAPTDFDLGPASGFAPGSQTVLLQIPAVLLYPEKGFMVRSLTCPHLGRTAP